MKRSTIITLIVLAVLLLAATVVVLRADRLAEQMTTEQIMKVAEEQLIPLTWSDLHVRLLHGSVQVDSLSVQLNLPDSVTGDTTRVALQVAELGVGRIHWLTLLRRRVVRLDRVRIDNAAVALCNTGDKTLLSLDSLCVVARDICYNLLDSTLTYNDSVYHLQLSNLDYTSADGLFRATVGSLLTSDAGSIVLRNISGGNTDKKEEHALKMGKQEVTWARFNLSEVRVSPVNIIRMALAKEVKLDTITIQGPKTEIYYDAHFPPKEPYPLPQESLEAVKMPLQIGYLKASLGLLHVGITMDGKHAGTLDLKKTHAQISDISNTPGSTMRTKVATHIGGSDIKIATDMKMNRQRSLTYNAELKNLKGSDLKSLTMPLLGVELNCNFRDITAKCQGTGETMTGSFCMLYDSLSLHVDDKGPVKELASLAWLVNAFSGVVLYNRNPRTDHEQPFTCEVSVEHDPMQPFPAYFIAVIGDGIVQTILPFGMGKGMMGKKKKK
ncbi:MAG: hypothetical protein IKO63_08460 [Paludibacteraceae bacterium]|nr:hypothetical protein [Paludibacteraceae bacterium]